FFHGFSSDRLSSLPRRISWWTETFQRLGFSGDMESRLQLKGRPTLPTANQDWLFAESLNYGSATETESLAEKQTRPQLETATGSADSADAVVQHERCREHGKGRRLGWHWRRRRGH